MAGTLIDKTDESLDAFFKERPIDAYESWARTQDADVLAGLASLGFFVRRDDLPAAFTSVAGHRGRVRELVASTT